MKVENLSANGIKIPVRKVSIRPPVEEFDKAAWSEKKVADYAREREEFRQEQQRIADEADVLGVTPDLIQRLAQRIYSLKSKPPKPVSRFWVANVQICTPGNLTTISAQAKAGKSAAIGAMIASTFAGSGTDCLGFVAENPDGFAVVHIDTEQCLFDHWEGIQRAIRRAKVASAPSWLRSHCLTGFSAADVRIAIRVLISQAAKQCGGIHSVFIDGIADAVPDVNDAEATSSLITELHELAIEFDCPILNIIHVNPGSDFKTRGHLGSQLERKSETNLRLKHDDGISVIFADKNRRAPIPEKSGPCFTWGNEAAMHVSVENPAETKAEAKSDAKRSAMQTDAQKVFADGKKSELRHKQLVELVATAFKLKPQGARRRVETWLDSQIVSKNDAGFYIFSP